MAVRHGYGKIAGADALVFAYDTGDTRNSYKGEPTENLITNPLPTSTSGFNSSGGTGTVTYDEVEKAIKWEQTAYSSWGTYFNIHPAFTGTLDTNAQYTFSFEYKSQKEFADSLMTHQVVQGNGQSPATTNENITSDTYGEVNGWKQYRVTFTPSNSGVSSAYNRIITGNRGTDVLRMWFRNIQFEKKSHKTSFTAGTRSATQGLLDLTGNRDLNLSTVSFDSDAQMIFDGTDDMIELTDNPQSGMNSVSWEFVSYFDLVHDNETSTYRQLYIQESSVWIGQYFDYIGIDIQKDNNVWFDGNGGRNTNSKIGPVNSGQYYHVVFTWDGTNVKGYLNGELGFTTAISGLTGIRPGSAPRRIGRRSGNPLIGQLPSTKLYSRALTAAEVKNNFNNYKGRFNL